jgi:predicted transcriptional regulator
MAQYNGPKLLRDFLGLKGLNQVTAANQLRIPPAALSQYLERKQRPRDDIRERIEKWSGGAVPRTAWRTAKELRAIEGIDEAVAPETFSDSEKPAKPAA